MKKIILISSLLALSLVGCTETEYSVNDFSNDEKLLEKQKAICEQTPKKELSEVQNKNCKAARSVISDRTKSISSIAGNIILLTSDYASYYIIKGDLSGVAFNSVTNARIHSQGDGVGTIKLKDKDCVKVVVEKSGLIITAHENADEYCKLILKDEKLAKLLKPVKF